MKKLIYYYGDSPVNVEGFSANCERSRKGALHLLRGRPITITDDEYAHIEKDYKWALPKIRIVAQITESKEEKKVEVKKEKVEVKKEQAPFKAEKPVEEKQEDFSDGKKPVFGKKQK